MSPTFTLHFAPLLRYVDLVCLFHTHFTFTLFTFDFGYPRLLRFTLRCAVVTLRFWCLHLFCYVDFTLLRSHVTFTHFARVYATFTPHTPVTDLDCGYVHVYTHSFAVCCARAPVYTVTFYVGLLHPTDYAFALGFRLFYAVGLRYWFTAVLRYLRISHVAFARLV